jgi:ribosomal protein S12 methylthiotransferase
LEENTTAYPLADPVPEKVKKERQGILMEIQKNISSSKNKGLVGKELKVLVEQQEGDYYVGRSYRDAPEVDGEVLIPIKNNRLNFGNFYNTIVYDFNEYDVFASKIK